MRYIILALLTLFLPMSAEAAPEVEKPAPDFKATAIDDNDVKLSLYKGHIVVLEWTNPGCPFTRKHYDSNNMQNLQNYAQNKGVIWLTINSSGPGKEGYMDKPMARTYILDNQMDITHYILDPKGTIGRLYGAKATPHMFVIDRKGNIAYMGAIDNKPTPNPASLESADNYVKDALDSLLEDKPVKVTSTQAYGCPVKYAD
jgi:peroxiredoxin